MDKPKVAPLSMMMEQAKGMLVDAFSQIQAQTNLPAYLLEGAVLNLLSEIRNQKNIELFAEYQRSLEPIEGETTTETEDNNG